MSLLFWCREDKEFSVMWWMCVVGAVLLIGLGAGCAAQRPATGKGATAWGVGHKVPVQYVCSSCGAKINREGVDTKSFIAKCPTCGKQFLTM